MINEACFALMEGVATREAIDTVMKLGMNHPMGPLALADLIGLDTCLSIMEVLHEGSATPSTAPARCCARWSRPAGWAARAAAASTSTPPLAQAAPMRLHDGSARTLHPMNPDTAIAQGGFSFDLTEDQHAVREMVRDFAESEIRPIAAKIDETHEFPAATAKKMAELGLLGMFVPEQYGGAGMDYLSYVIAIEELSRVCASHGVIASVNNSLVCYPILTYGNEAQKKKYLMPLAKGELLGAYCLTEPNAGSNAANQQTTAVPDGDHCVLNGTKMFITNAGPADVLVVYAATDKALGAQGHLGVHRRRGHAGREEGQEGAEARHPRLGHARDRVRERARAEGEPARRAATRATPWRWRRWAAAASASRRRRSASRRRRSRRRSSTPTSASSSTARSASSTRSAHMLADSAVELETARLLVYQAAWLRDQGRPHVKEASLAKWHASEAATRCANWAIQVHGGYGYLTEFHVERYWRDARICEIYEGTTEVQKMVVAAQVLKEHAIEPGR